MLGKLFGKKPRQQNPVALMFLCRRDPGDIPWATVLDRILQVNEEVELESSEGDSGPATFDFGSCMVMAMPIPAPIPGEEVEHQIPFSRYWTFGDSTDHAAHVVLMGAQGEIVDQMESVALVAKAISETVPCVCWYVGNASHILEPTAAAELAEADGSIPIWVNVLVSQNPNGGIDASTIGMEALGHHEFEIVGSRQDPSDIHGRLLDLAFYVLKSGPVLKHGQTFGATMDERISIEVGKSRLGKPGTVIRLGY